MEYLLGFILIFSILWYRATATQRSHKRWRQAPEDPEMDYVEARRDDLDTNRGHYFDTRNSHYPRQQHTNAYYNPNASNEREQDFYERSGDLPDGYQPDYTPYGQNPYQRPYTPPHQQHYYPQQHPYQDPYRNRPPRSGYDPRFDRYPQEPRNPFSGFVMGVGLTALASIVLFFSVFDIRALSQGSGKVAPAGAQVIVIQDLPEYKKKEPNDLRPKGGQTTTIPKEAEADIITREASENASIYDPEQVQSRHDYKSADMVVVRFGRYSTAEEALSKTECFPSYRIEVIKIGEEYWPCIFWGRSREGIDLLKQEVRAHKAELADFNITKVSILNLSDFCDELSRRRGADVWIGK